MKTQTPKTTTKHYKHMPQSKAHELQPVVARSDRRIKDALTTLQDSERGREALSDLRKLCKGAASGFDMVNMSALVILVREFAYGRRDFLEQIHETKGDGYTLKVLLRIQSYFKTMETDGTLPCPSEFIMSNLREAIRREGGESKGGEKKKQSCPCSDGGEHEEIMRAIGH
jgi:hypothetical protein